MTTVLSATSQRKYTIDNDTIIGFTPYETRQVALMLIEGDKYKELYINDSMLISKKDIVIDNLRYMVMIGDSTIKVQYTNLKLLNDDNVKYQRALRRSKNGNIILGTAIALLGGTTLYFLLK